MAVCKCGRNIQLKNKSDCEHQTETVSKQLLAHWQDRSSPSLKSSVETHPAPRAPLKVVALHIRRALVDRLNEQTRARIVAVRRALVVVAALEPSAPTAVLAILIKKQTRRQHCCYCIWHQQVTAIGERTQLSQR